MAEARTSRESATLPRPLLGRVVHAFAGELGRARLSQIRWGEHSNPRAEIRFDDGRALIVKRLRAPWAAAASRTSRRAARLVRAAPRVIAPRPRRLPPDLTRGFGNEPLEAYWRIPFPTLLEVWPALSTHARAGALRSWGALLRRLHSVELPGYGHLGAPEVEPQALDPFLTSDLERRLLPAVAATWNVGRPAVEALVRAVPAAAASASGRGAVLVHNDLHMANVLCRVGPEGPRCVGVLDLEEAFAGPAEADLARTGVLHGPLFGQPLPGFWFRRLLEGYGRESDRLALRFFRAYALVNLGFHAALTGYDAHAADVARAAEAELHRLRRRRR